jgi:hypothetical protein
MKTERSDREKAIAMANTAAFVFGMLIIALAAVTTILTKGHFEAVLTEMASRELPVLTKCILSVHWIGFGAFVATLVFFLILKEILVRPKGAKLVVNIVVAVGGLAYIAIYAHAMLSPMGNNG